MSFQVSRDTSGCWSVFEHPQNQRGAPQEIVGDFQTNHHAVDAAPLANVHPV